MFIQRTLEETQTPIRDEYNILSMSIITGFMAEFLLMDDTIVEYINMYVKLFVLKV